MNKQFRTFFNIEKVINMEIQNLINAIYNSKSHVKNDLLSRLKVGDILKAKVLAMVGDIITLEVGGNLTIEAKDLSGINYNIGDMAEFIVADKADEKLFIKSNLKGLNSLETKLSKMGIKLDQNNKELIELLYKNQIPITKDVITEIMSTKNYYGKVIDLIKENDIQVDKNILNNNIKEVLKNLVQNNNEKTSLKTTNKLSSDIKNNMLVNKSGLQNENNNISAKEFNLQYEKNLENNKYNDISFIKDFINKENNITFEKLVFMLKNNLKFNTKNLVLLDNIVLGKKNITNQIENLIKTVEDNSLSKDLDVNNKKNDTIKNTKDNLLEILRRFDISNIKEKDKLNLAVKELMEKFEAVKNNIFNKEVNDVFNKHFEEIKASLDFVNKLNDNMSFFQIPLYMNNSLKNLDVYIKNDSKSSKKIKTNNTKIFISLNTNNLDLVQVLIEINKKNINLNFRVCDEKIKSIIKSNETILVKSLKEYNFDNIMFKYNISTDKISLTNIAINESKNEFNTLDIRV